MTFQKSDYCLTTIYHQQQQKPTTMRRTRRRRKTLTRRRTAIYQQKTHKQAFGQSIDLAISDIHRPETYEWRNCDQNRDYANLIWGPLQCLYAILNYLLALCVLVLSRLSNCLRHITHHAKEYSKFIGAHLLWVYLIKLPVAIQWRLDKPHAVSALISKIEAVVELWIRFHPLKYELIVIIPQWLDELGAGVVLKCRQKDTRSSQHKYVEKPTWLGIRDCAWTVPKPNYSA